LRIVTTESNISSITFSIFFTQRITIAISNTHTDYESIVLLAAQWPTIIISNSESFNVANHECFSVHVSFITAVTFSFLGPFYFSATNIFPKRSSELLFFGIVMNAYHSMNSLLIQIFLFAAIRYSIGDTNIYPIKHAEHSTEFASHNTSISFAFSIRIS
jgi:hypothetical protein